MQHQHDGWKGLFQSVRRTNYMLWTGLPRRSYLFARASIQFLSPDSRHGWLLLSVQLFTNCGVKEVQCGRGEDFLLRRMQCLSGLLSLWLQLPLLVVPDADEHGRVGLRCHSCVCVSNRSRARSTHYHPQSCVQLVMVQLYLHLCKNTCMYNQNVFQLIRQNLPTRSNQTLSIPSQIHILCTPHKCLE